MADKPESDDKEKSLYLLQIQYLDEQLSRCQLRCDELEKRNKHLASRYTVLDKEKKDVTEILKCAEAVKEKRVEELKEQLARQHQAVEQVREALKLPHRKNVQELQEQIDILNLKSRMQVAKIKEQKEQVAALMQQLSEAEDLEKQLLSQREKHEAVIHGLSMEAMSNTEKLTEVVQHQVDKCVQEKISEILMVERAQHSKVLEQQQHSLREREILTKEIDILQESDIELSARSDDMDKEIEMVTLETHKRKKVVKKLWQEWREVRQKVRDWSITHVKDQMEALREQMASVSEELSQKTAEADQLEAEIKKERSRSRQLMGIKQEAAIILRHIMMGSLKPSETQWRKQRLLEILESTAPQGAASFLSDPTQTSSQGQKPQTSGPKPASQKTSSSVDSSAPAPHQIQRQEPPPPQNADPNPVSSKKHPTKHLISK